jgi:NAD(P)-dependent dehydrogenase (short-subunit alcohol dehydrogenase family)
MSGGSPGRLHGKAVVAVGAGQTAGASIGIGRAGALLFARHGARLLLVDRDEASVTETRQMIEDEGGEAHIHLADIRKDADCAAVAAEARSRLGGVDVLYNSVGVHGMGKAADITEDQWDSVLDINLRAQWLVCRHVLPIMQEQRSGSIVLISSIAAARGQAGVAYSVSKAGVNRLAMSIAVGYAEYDIRANAIMPGLVDTPMAIDSRLHDGSISRADVAAQRASTVPLSAVGTAWDVAHAALYFASEESRYVTGQCLAVDGGRSAL